MEGEGVVEAMRKMELALPFDEREMRLQKEGGHFEGGGEDHKNGEHVWGLACCLVVL